MITVGIDIGSRSSKAIVLKDHKILASSIYQSAMKVVDKGNIIYERVLEKAGIEEKDVDYIVATGYGRVNAPFADQTVTEITCHAKGIHTQCPSVRTVIDIGGQDSKVIKLNEAGEVVDFAMNDRCAAGTGKFLEVTSKAMELDMATFSKYYFDSKRPCKISSMCTVFAESEVISLLSDGNKAHDIVAGLIKAVTRRVGNMAKRLKVVPDIAFTGGVAKNKGVKVSLEKEVGRQFIEFDLDPQLNGAYGAAIIAREYLLASGAKIIPANEDTPVVTAWKSLKKLEALIEARPDQLSKQKAAGQKVVGFFCSYVPLEIIHAAGMTPIRLNNGGDVEVSAIGNTYLSSCSCPYVCSCVGAKQKGDNFYFEAVDVVADAPSCLQMKRVLEVWGKYFNTQIIHIGLSRKYYTPEGLRFYKDSLRYFVKELEAISGNKITRERLRESVELFNSIRRYQRRLYQALNTTALTWSALIKFIQAGNILDKVDYLELLKSLFEEVTRHGEAKQTGPPLRILITGGMLASGDNKLINIFHGLEMDFTMDELCNGSRSTFIDIKTASIEAIAAAYLENVPCGALPHPDLETDPRVKHIENLIKQYNVNGILYYTLRFCDAYSFKLKELKKHMQNLDIPILHLHSDYSDSDIGQIKTRVEAFKEALLRGQKGEFN